MIMRNLRDQTGYFYDLIRVLVLKELKVRYRGTVLGVLWSLANPLAFCLVLYVAFKQVFRIEIEAYPLFLLSALFPWQWFSSSANAAAMLFLYNAPLIKKLQFPRYALCLAVVSSDMVHFLATIPILLFLVWHFYGHWPSSAMLIGFPILLITQAILTFSLVLLVSTVNAVFRDLEQLVRVGLLLLLYVTPILFPIGMVPRNLDWMLVFNPVAPLMIAWRTLVLEGVLSPYIGLAILYAILLLVLAIPVYRKLGWRLAELV